MLPNLIETSICRPARKGGRCKYALSSRAANLQIQARHDASGGQRVAVRRPKQLCFDEVAVTYATWDPISRFHEALEQARRVLNTISSCSARDGKLASVSAD